MEFLSLIVQYNEGSRVVRLHWQTDFLKGTRSWSFRYYFVLLWLNS